MPRPSVAAMTTWPELPYADWADTFDTVHLIVQILGKVRLALSPKEPEWAHITLYVSTRGLTTGPVPSAAGLLEVEADFVEHQVVITTSAGDATTVALRDRPIAGFWTEFVAALRAVGVGTELSTMPQEVADPIAFPVDTTHHAYDAEAAQRFWRVLTLIEPVFGEYRARFQGRVSRVQFFWGSADLTVTRFAGDEQISIGWWPGSASFPDPAFYAYAVPKHDGVEDAPLGVPGAAWNAELGEFIVMYDEIRRAPSPAAALGAFLDAAYDACASGAGWDPGLVASG